MADGPESLHDWIQYLHAASQAAKQNPRDREASNEVADALRHINALQTGANVADVNAVEASGPNAAAATGLGALHGLSGGTGEVLRGTASALKDKPFRTAAELAAGPMGLPFLLRDPSFGRGAQDYRQSLSQIEQTSPVASAIGETVGPALLPAARAQEAIEAGVPLGIKGVGALMGRSAGPAAALGGLSGFSSGGDDLASRTKGAVQGAAGSALLSAILAGTAAPFTRRHVEGQADIVKAANERASARLGAERKERMMEAVPSQIENARLQPELTRARIRMYESRTKPAEPALPAGVTREEAAVARTLGIPVEQVRGRVGTPASRSAPTVEATPISEGSPGSAQAATGPTAAPSSPAAPQGGPGGPAGYASRAKIAPANPAAGTPGDMLGGVLRIQSRALQILKGPVTRASQQELMTLLQQAPPGNAQLLLRAATPQWQALLTR